MDVPDAELSAALARVRGEIEAVDREIVMLIARRADLAREAGRVKRAAGLPVVDPAREHEVLERVHELAHAAGLPYTELVDLMRRVIDVSRRAQGGSQE
jgi:prephenate dehydrogenase